MPTGNSFAGCPVNAWASCPLRRCWNRATGRQQLDEKSCINRRVRLSRAGNCLFSALAFQGVLPGGPLSQLLGETDKDSFGTPDVAEPIHVLILGHVANEL